ncbi:hypothetical protein SLS62_002212 [Diatrype stigma]|uniref:Uncharacterized protein n=1 Tax=Diatrype stigma TaxID=117547 RepID=A0AAN9UV24_9PEZI
MGKFRPAWKTLEENEFVNNPDLSEYDRIYLRGIQSTYKVKQEHWADRGYVFQIRLVWDQDRIWGDFDFGPYKGILMVDHGPEREPPEWSGQQGGDGYDEAEDDGAIYFDFTWRGVKRPSTTINNPQIAKGKIEFGSSWISGYFEGMPGAGLPDGRRYFDGNPEWGPPRVPRSLQSFVREWNSLDSSAEDETVRQAP